MELLEKLLGINIWLTIITFIFLLALGRILLTGIAEIILAFRSKRNLDDFNQMRNDLIDKFEKTLKENTKDK